MEDIEERIQQSAKGDQEAFKGLYDDISSRLFAYLAARVSSREEALDVLQEVCIDLWQALPTFRYSSKEAWYGFVFTIAKRRLIKVYRKGEAPASLDALHEEGNEFVDTPSGIEPGERVAIARALRKLDETSRDIVELRHFGGLSFAEIATVLGMQESAVKVRHHRAMKALQTSFAEYGGR